MCSINPTRHYGGVVEPQNWRGVPPKEFQYEKDVSKDANVQYDGVTVRLQCPIVVSAVSW